MKSDCILINIFKVGPLGSADRPDVEHMGEKAGNKIWPLL